MTPALCADPVSPLDPPRHQVTTVTLNGATFTAQSILLPAGVMGFHQQDTAGGSRLMIVQQDGAARLNVQPQNQTWVGRCTGA